jgi:hypothetical protein
MRAFVIGVCGAVVCAMLLGMVAFGQAGARRDPPAPTDKSASGTLAEMTAVAQELASKKETTDRFFGEKGYNLEVRRLVGP